MAAVADELRASCAGAFVDQVHQPEALAVVLAFTGRGPRRYWLLSSDARWPRCHATTVRRSNPVVPPNFCMLLRKHLGGAHLESVEQVRFDRVLRLEFRRGDEQRILVHEVMGRHSNLVLLDETGLVLGAVKTVPPSQTRVRPVLPGHPYQDPPGARPDPRSLSPDQLARLLEGVETAEEITRRLSGWGTFAAREAMRMSSDECRVSSGSSHLGRIVFQFMEQVRRGEYQPTVFEEGGRPKGVWAFPSIQDGWTHGRAAASISGACDEYYEFLEANAAREALRKSVAGALERALRTARLQLAEAEGHLEGLDEADGLRIRGELLSAAGARVERGAPHVDLPNWYSPEGESLRVELDPELDGRENAERYFYRYRRAMASAEAALERIPQLTSRVAELESLRETAASAEEERLRELLALVREQGLLREQGPGRSSEGKQVAPEFPPGVRVRRVPVGAWEIYYGENATSNDYLTTRWARPGDLWLHARAVAGSHVVVRGVNSLDRLPPEVLREAARLAAAHSEAKHSSLVSVDYTFRRYVRKPRGSAPGRVTYTGERTLNVEPGK